MMMVVARGPVKGAFRWESGQSHLAVAVRRACTWDHQHDFFRGGEDILISGELRTRESLDVLQAQGLMVESIQLSEVTLGACDGSHDDGCFRCMSFAHFAAVLVHQMVHAALSRV